MDDEVFAIKALWSLADRFSGQTAMRKIREVCRSGPFLNRKNESTFPSEEREQSFLDTEGGDVAAKTDAGVLNPASGIGQWPYGHQRT